MSPAAHGSNWERELHRLFVEAFTPEELRRVIYFLCKELRNKLPAAGGDPEDFAFGVLERLIKGGHVTAEFFAALAREKSNLRARVEAVRGLWECGDGGAGEIVTRAVSFEGPHGVAVTAMADFTGRVQALDELERLLRADSTGCVVATGIGGIGKTSLVRQFVAVRGRACFPDGAAWLDGGDLIRDLARVSRRFGWLESRDPTPAEATALLRRELSGLRFVIVVDSFDPDGDVTQIPVAGGVCRTVVTTRALTLSHGLPDAQALELGLWRADECLAFLRGDAPRLARVPEAELLALAEFVGRLPLGVRLVASFLVNRPGLSATAALAELQRQPLGALDKYRGRYVGLVATFQAAWDALDDDGRRVLQAMAVCARETRTDVVGAVAGVADASAMLDNLTTRSLVQFSDMSESPWSLHDVVRMFVAAQPGGQAFAEAHVAWVEKYLASHENPINHREFAAGVAETTQAFDQLLVCGDIQRVDVIYRRLSEHLIRVGQLVKAMLLSEALLRHCPSESDIAVECMGRLGLCERKLGRMQRAIECHTRALAVEEKQGRECGQANQLTNLGSCYLTLGETGKAVECYRKALILFESQCKMEEQVCVIGNLASCYRALGKTEKAIESLECVLDFFVRLGRLEGQATALGNLGLCYESLGDSSAALMYHERALIVEEMLGRLEGQARVLGNLGLSYQTQGETGKAIEFHERSLVISERLGLLEEQGNQLVHLGSCYRQVDEIRKALEYYEGSLAISQKLGLLDRQAICLCNLGLCHERLGEIVLARDYYRQGLLFFRRMELSDSHEWVREVLEGIARVG